MRIIDVVARHAARCRVESLLLLLYAVTKIVIDLWIAIGW